MTDSPGVTVGNIDSAYSVNVMGSTGAETPLMVDGVVTNHPASGGGSTHFNLDAIGEVSATTLGASAEFQGAAGGVLNVITKAGTNQFRGTPPVFMRPGVFKPADHAAVQLPRWPDWLHRVQRSRPLDASGGPILRNGAWFYGGLTFAGQSAPTPGQAPLAPADQYLSGTPIRVPR